MASGKVQIYGGKVLIVGGKVATGDPCCCDEESWPTGFCGGCANPPTDPSDPHDWIVDLGDGGLTNKTLTYCEDDSCCDLISGEYRVPNYIIPCIWASDMIELCQLLLGTQYVQLRLRFNGWSIGGDPLQMSGKWTLQVYTWVVCQLLRYCHFTCYESETATVETGEGWNCEWRDEDTGKIPLTKISEGVDGDCWGGSCEHLLCNGSLPETVHAWPVDHE